MYTGTRYYDIIYILINIVAKMFGGELAFEGGFPRFPYETLHVYMWVYMHTKLIGR